MVSKKNTDFSSIAAGSILTHEAAAEFLGLTKETLRLKAVQGAIKGYKVGRKWFFRSEDITAYITDNEGK